MTPVNDYRTRPTGLPWLPTVPETWRIVPFRRLFRESTEVNGATPVGEMLSVSSYRGVETKHYDDDGRRRTAEEVENYRVVRPGQLAVNTMWLNYAGLGVSERLGHVSPAYRSYEIDPSLNRRFVHHLMRSSIYVDAYTALLTGIRPNSLQMSRSDLFGFPILIPPQEEQAAIAAYLDRETAEIDAFIADQEKLIELLTERRVATIAHAVSRGVSAHAKLCSSNTPHLGLVPEHWAVSGLNRWASASAGAGFPHEYQGRTNEALPFYKVNSLARADGDGVIRFREDTISPATAHQLRATIFPAGTVVLAKIGAALLLGRIRALATASCLDNNMLGLTPKETVDPAFLRYNAQTVHFAPVTNPGAVPSLSESKFMSFPLAWPPLKEQKHIVEYLRTETAEIDANIADARLSIDLSKERRAALISAAVTGKIDVREHWKVDA